MSKLNQEELLKELDWRWDVTYKDGKRIRLSQQAYQQIKEMIQKPEVTEEWIEEKANKWWAHPYNQELEDMKDFIRSLVEEIK